MTRITDGNGCIISKLITVYEPAPLVLTNTVTPVSCNGGSDGTITINVTGGTLPYSYNWTNNSTTQNQVNLTAGYYDVAVTDVNGCKINSNHYEVQQPIAISTTIDVTQISCKDEHDGAALASAFGGVGGFTYSWSNGVSGPSIQNLSANVYVLTTVDANNCSKTDTVFIYPNTQNCIEIANTFTPNGDGKNDTWIIYNIWLYPNATVKVFNEWGNLLFASTGYATPWDGRYNGNALPSATYYYIIDLNNGEAAYTGPITIVR
jgi:gliding motility-associated-like protein